MPWPNDPPPSGMGAGYDQRYNSIRTPGNNPFGTGNMGYGPGAEEAGAQWRGWSGLGFMPANDPNADQARRMAQESGGWFQADGGPAAQYASLFGNVTPQSRVTSGQGMGPDPAMTPNAMRDPNRFANGGGANNTPQPPASTPQQAGQNNSAMPGWSNGQPNVGFPAEYPPMTKPGGARQPVGMTPAQQGAAPDAMRRPAPMPGRTATDPLNVALASVPPPAQPGYHANGIPLIDPVTGQPNVPKSGEEMIGYGDVGDGTKAATAGEGGVIPPPRNNWNFNLGTQPLPTTPIAGFDAPIATDEQTAHWLIGKIGTTNGVPTSLTRLADQLTKMIWGDARTRTTGLVQLGQSGGLNGPNVGNMLRKGQEIESYLNSLGINWKPFSSAIEAMKPGGGTGGGTGGGGTGTGTGTGGGGSGGYPGDPGGNTDSAALDVDSAWRYLAGILGAGFVNEPKNRAFVAEMAMAVAQNRQAEANKQQGVNIYGDAIGDIKDDPLRAQETEIMSGILDRPDNVPWDVVRSNAISDAHKTAEAGAQRYGASAARRLGSAGAGATPGVFAQLQRQQGNDLSRLLGDIEVQQAQGGRDAEYRALAAGRDFRGSTVDQDAERARTLAAMVMGRPDVGPNPVAGAAESWVNSNTFNKAQNQGEPGFDWAAAGLGLVDAFFQTDLSGAYAAGKGTGGGSGGGANAAVQSAYGGI